jgi:2'-phosphotransferase
LSSLTQLDLAGLQRIVENDSKQRYMLLKGPDDTSPTAGEIWWIRANQGHSMKVPLNHMHMPAPAETTLTPMQEVKLNLKPILSATDIPMAVHGTNRTAWESICTSQLRGRITLLIVVMQLFKVFPEGRGIIYI